MGVQPSRLSQLPVRTGDRDTRDRSALARRERTVLVGSLALRALSWLSSQAVSHNFRYVRVTGTPMTARRWRAENAPCLLLRSPFGLTHGRSRWTRSTTRRSWS